MRRTYSSSEAAKLIGISVRTLYRWEERYPKLFGKVKRDYRGYRRFTEAQVRRLKQFKEKLR